MLGMKKRRFGSWKKTFILVFKKLKDEDSNKLNKHLS